MGKKPSEQFNPAIDRRDFLNGVAISIGAATMPAGALLADAPYYPPSLTGMRGSHPGSFENAHAVVQGQTWQATKSDETYDLVIVGAGISGLSAAYIHHRDVNPNARILILDNHDDFGGHAKRNEFNVDGKTVIGFGGTMYITQPGGYPKVSIDVLRELGITEISDRKYSNQDLFDKYSLSNGTFFDKETFGADHLAMGSFRTTAASWDVSQTALQDTLDDVPLSEKGKADVKRLFDDKIDYLSGKTMAEKRQILNKISYRDFLVEYGKFGAEALALIQKRPHGTWAIGADSIPAWMAHSESYPGFGGMQLHEKSEDDSVEQDVDLGNFRFPDGNATVARLLVTKLVPDMAPGADMHSIVMAKFDYSKLDRKSNKARIRLNSTAVNIAHQNGDMNAHVDVTYVKDNKASTVTAKQVIWAGYHAMMPYVCDDIPAKQAEGMAGSVRAPLVYTSVALRNWHSLVKSGLYRAYYPGGFFHSMRITHTTGIGGYEFAKTPDDPIILHLQHIPTDPGLPVTDQFRAGRNQLLTTPFSVFEHHVRDQLTRVLGRGGFDADHDIAGIAVNRWSHGYAYSTDVDSGDVAFWPSRWPHPEKPWINARARFGNIAIAGTDAAANAMTEAAIEEAHRAVHELT